MLQVKSLGIYNILFAAEWCIYNKKEIRTLKLQLCEEKTRYLQGKDKIQIALNENELLSI